MPSLFYPTRLKQLVIFFVCCFTSAASLDALEIDFDSQIKPIFAAHCLSCHDEENEEGGFLIDRETSLDYIIAGNAEESDFFKYLVTDDEDQLMPPPDEENPLSQQQITLVKTWINEGAEWPEDISIEDEQTATTGNAVAAMDDVQAGGEDAEEVLFGEVTPQVLKDATGSLHPAAIHLPIGLLLAAGLFAFLSLRGNFVMSDCAYYCLWIGALGSIAACVTGWFYSPMEHQGDVAVLADLWDTTQDVFLHRTWGLGSSVAALLLALMAMGTRARDPDDGMLWKLGTIVLAGVIGWVGHLGGELTYGKAHYKDLNTVIESVVPAVKNLGEDAAEPADNVEPADSVDADDSASTDEPSEGSEVDDADGEESDSIELDVN